MRGGLHMSNVVEELSTQTKQFYPTPKTLVEKMCSFINWNTVHNILEPSAGKGDIVNYVVERYLDKECITCVEIDKDLCKILQEDGYAVYNGDFMHYSSQIVYDCIIMNPPFKVAVQHIVKALQMLSKHGGQLVCILNATNLQHLQCSNVGKELYTYMQKYKAHVEIINNAFKHAERTTQVQIALMYFNIPIIKQSSIFDNMVKAVKQKEIKITETQNALEINDVIKSLVMQYTIEVQCGLKLIAEYKELAPKMLKSLKNEMYRKPILELRLTGRNIALSETAYVESTRIKYWSYLFESGDFTKLFTQKLLDEYRAQLQNFRAYDFTLANIYQVRVDMQKQLTKSLQDSILEMFEQLTFKNSMDCAGNIHYYNGWRTNDAFKLNKRVVYPYANGYEAIFGKYILRYDFQKFLIDLEHVFDYLGGTAPDQNSVMHFRGYVTEFKKVPFRYFNVTLYKKGTAHIEFLNDMLLKKFNLYGAFNKGWLPNSYGRKTYSQMNAEEQHVVDAFEGAESYMKDMNNVSTRQFLINMPQNNMLQI